MSAVESMPLVAIVLVNWNAWADTIECLESALRLDYPAFQLIVCDNASTDGSVERFKAWAKGERVWPGPGNPQLAHLTTPPRPKPLHLEVITAGQAADECTRAAEVVVIETGANLGFAGGNNVGIRHALAQPDVGFVWLLNNDTVVEPDTLRHLVTRMAANPQAGPCGATLRFYDRPGIVQSRSGCRFNRWTSQARCIGNGEPAGRRVSREAVERRTDFVTGASMFLSRAFLETVGLMEERYFLYFEEIDWAVRAGKRFPALYAPEATVYHKEGGSIGSSSCKGSRSSLSEFHLARSKLLFTRKFFPWLLPVIYASSLVQILRRIFRGQWTRAGVILRAHLGAKTP